MKRVDKGRQSLHVGCVGKFLLVVLGIVIALGATEAAARVTFPHPGKIKYVPDEVVGFRHRPLQQVWLSNEQREFRVRFTTNTHGDPDRERTPQKLDGVFRIAMIGDSMVQAAQVEHTERFTTLLEQALTAWVRQQGAAIREVEVLNFGTGGYGTAQEWLNYRTHVRRFDPDLVVLFLLPGNDIKNNSFELEVTRSCRPEVMPFYTVDRDGKLVPREGQFYENVVARYEDATNERSTLLALKEQVRLVALSQQAYVAMRAGAASNTSLENPDCQTEATLELFDSTIQQTATAWQEAWQVTAALMQAMAQDVVQDGAAFHVVTLTGPWEVHEATRDLVLSDDAQAAYDWELPHRLSERMLSELGLEHTMVLAPILEAAQNGDLVHFIHDGHYTATGHQIIAEQLLPVLQEYILP